jgi:hypothetical protein
MQFSQCSVHAILPKTDPMFDFITFSIDKECGQSEQDLETCKAL